MTKKQNSKLEGWKEIASYLKISTRTAMRWEKNNNLPIYRDVNGKIFSSKIIIDDWKLNELKNKNKTKNILLSKYFAKLKNILK